MCYDTKSFVFISCVSRSERLYLLFSTLPTGWHLFCIHCDGSSELVVLVRLDKEAVTCKDMVRLLSEKITVSVLAARLVFEHCEYS